MLTYYLDLALRSFKRNVGLTALMILAIAFGVGASMTTLTVLHVLTADPIPDHSRDLYYVQLDPRELTGYVVGGEPMRQLSRFDAEALLRARRADRQAMMSGGTAAVQPSEPGRDAFIVDGRWTSADYFALFRLLFVAGGAWTAADDEAAARVAVIAAPLAIKLFGTTDVVGRTIRVENSELRITGVTELWRATPHFYDLTDGAYTSAEVLFIPFSTSRALSLSRIGSMDCWTLPKVNVTLLEAPCAWLQFWVELDSEAKRAAYHDFLVHYSEDQRAAGRFQRPPGVRLRNVPEWLAFNDVVPDDVRLQLWIALGFLMVCLVNTVGLLLTKFLRRSPEIGVRRALGASKRSIFAQLLVESGVVGLVGGVLGLGLAGLGLWAVRQQPSEHAELARLDGEMLAATFALAIVTSLLAGLLPALRGCQVTPAVQLKSH